MFEWHKKEAPVFTGIARGVGGFGFGKSAAGGAAVSSGPFTVTGGAVLETDTHYVHYLSTVGSNPVVVTGSGLVDILLVGGGGGGGGGCPGGSGGGGGGGVIYQTSLPISSGSYTATIGSGGATASGNSGSSNAGGNTTLFGLTAFGGGAGVGHPSGGQPPNSKFNGGSGGGGSNQPGYTTAGTGSGASHPGGLDAETPAPIRSSGGWGYPGGSGNYTGNYAGGGGGGSGGAGVNHPGFWDSAGLYGKGGDGARYSISGQPLYYSGGGGGGYGEEAPGPALSGGIGGLGGGGVGGRAPNHGSFPNPTFPNSVSGSSATQYGAGGGGHGYKSADCNGVGGAGYQGVVMVRYPKASSPRSTSSLSASGGDVNGLQPGNGYKYHTFTSPGTFTVSSGTTDVEILIVGAGGGTPGASGCCIGHAGGGAGGILYGALTVTPGPYSVTIGTGSPGSNGGNTSFGSHTALGGGRGGTYAGSSVPGTPGGSGGGGGWGSAPAPTRDLYGHRGVQTPSASLTGYGNPGGNSSEFSVPNPQATNGGGGGAGEAGWPGGGGGSTGNGSGAGGNGLQFPQFTGSLIGVPSLSPLNGYFAGGGGSGTRTNGGGGGVGSGGAGGGGTGSGGGGGGDGVTNSGGGAGGPVGSPSPTGSSTGGPGIVVVRYKV